MGGSFGEAVHRVKTAPQEGEKGSCSPSALRVDAKAMHITMILKDIYLTALALIGESEDNHGTADYAARAVPLLTVILFRFVQLSDALTGTVCDRSRLSVSSLNDAFLLDERLASASSLALASFLILDELPSISNELDERAKKAADTVAKEASVIGSTREVYP